ncbi:MAG: SdrD B-like domain-containing protein [Caldilineaceae bacterium]
MSNSGSAGNGTCDGNLDEPGISGVTVTLVGAGTDGILGTTDDITRTTTTNGSGIYSFADLGPGLYQSWRPIWPTTPAWPMWTAATRTSSIA